MRRTSSHFALAIAVAALVGCQLVPPPAGAPQGPAAWAVRPLFQVDRTPATLLEPAGVDWMSQHVVGSRILESRRAHFARLAAASGAPASKPGTRGLSAFSAPSAAWQSGGVDGIPLTTLDPAGGLNTDYVPNGPAAVYATANTPAAAQRCLFFLSQKGKLTRVKQDGSAASTLDVGAGGHTFTHTYVTISPAGGRVYLLSDDGTFFVVNTANTPMTFQSVSTGVSGNSGLAVSYDPFTSNAADLGDDVYVPLANGTIKRYRVNRVTGGEPTVTAVSSHNTSGALWGALKATPVVLGGTIYLGDQSGNIVRYDVASGAVVSTVSLGYPVNAGVALNMDDFGNISDLFVNVGSRCAWITYDGAGTATSTNLSRPLYLDEGDTDDSGVLANWTYGTATKKYWVPAKEALTLNTHNGGVAPPGLGAPSTNQWLTWASSKITAGTTTTVATGNKPSDIAVDPTTGDVWITSEDTNTLYRYDASGALIGTYPTGIKPTSVAVDPSGNVWVTNENDNTVMKYSSAGVLLGTYPTGDQPKAVATDASGNVWVVNNNDNTVSKISPTGVMLGTYPVGDDPKSVAIDASGNVWVTNNNDDTVTKLSSTGVVLGTYAVGTGPEGIAIDAAGNAWVVNKDDDTVTKLSPTGAVLGTYPVGDKPRGIFVDPATGYVYVANEGSDSYTTLTDSGLSLGTTTTGDKPRSIAVDTSGVVWAVNRGGNSVTRTVPGNEGPVYGYARWDLAGSYLPSAAKVAGLKVWFKVQSVLSAQTTPPILRAASHLHTGGSAWTYGTGTGTDMTHLNEPVPSGLGGAAFAVATANTDGWGTLTNGRQAWAANSWYGMRISAPPTTLSTDYAVAVLDDSNTNDQFVWQGGPAVEQPGNSPGAMVKYAPRYYVDPTQAGNPQGMVTANSVTTPASGTTSVTPAGTTYFDSQVTPLLEVEASGKALPAVSLETPPVIDAFGTRKYVYVLSSNAVFCLDFTSAASWQDATGTSTKFVVTRMGDSANGTPYGPTYPPSTAPAANRYANAIEHRSAPLLNYNGTALYVLDRYPGDTSLTPATYKYGVTKIAIVAGGIRSDGLKGYDPAVGSNPGNYEELTPAGALSAGTRDASSYLTLDLFSATGGGDHLYFALPAGAATTGYVYQVNP